MKRLSGFLICCGAAAACWALVGQLGPGQAVGEDLATQPSTLQITPATTTPGDTLKGDPTGAPDALEMVSFSPPPSPSPEPTRAPDEAGVVAGADYDFSQIVPETEPVEDAYFADAVFVGDSRTRGFQLFSGLTAESDYLFKTGLSVFQWETEKVDLNGKKLTVAEALARKEYGKVYVCLGLNELGMCNDQGYYDHYADLIDCVRATRPQATVYIQLLIPVNEQKRAEKGVADYINNAQIQVYNDLLRQLAQEKHVFLVDPAQAVVDETGQPPYDEVDDGVHFTKGPYQRWLDYLRRHTVSMDKGELE